MVFGRSDVTFTFRHSKTNRFHACVRKAVQIPDHLLDPVRAVDDAVRVCRMLTPRDRHSRCLRVAGV